MANVSSDSFIKLPEKCSGGKLSKICITDLAVANAVGDKLPMFVIEKAKKLRCFINEKFPSFYPVVYRNQQKSWMDVLLFEEWAREMGKKCISE